jgi:hypothetical protein
MPVLNDNLPLYLKKLHGALLQVLYVRMPAGTAATTCKRVRLTAGSFTANASYPLVSHCGLV